MKLPIPDDWNGVDCCRWAVSWPDSPLWLGILDGLLSLPARGRFWDEGTGSIVNTQNSFKPFYEANFVLQEVIVACGDNGIAEGLQAIAAAFRDKPDCGCSGSGIANCWNSTNVDVQAYVALTDGTNWPIYGTAPIPELPLSGIPEGYDTLEQFDVDKCAKATKLVDDWTATIKNFGAVNWGVGVIGAAVVLACIVGLVTVPPAVIPLLLFALTANEGIAAVFINLGNWMTANREDLICILYTGDNIDVMIGLLSDALDTAIAAIGVSGAIAVAVKSVALWLVNSDTLGVLLTAGSKDLYPTADCSSCVPCGYSWDFTIEDYDGTPTPSDTYNCGSAGAGWTSATGWQIAIATQTNSPECDLVYGVTVDLVEPALAVGIAFVGVPQNPGQNAGFCYRILGTQDGLPYDSGEILTGIAFSGSTQTHEFPDGQVLVSSVWFACGGTGFGGSPSTVATTNITSLAVTC